MVVRGAVGLCVASVGLGDIHVLFAWQAWHLVTSQVLLHGRHGSYGTGLALAAHLVQVRTLCGMRSLAAMAQVPWVGSGGALSPHWSPRAPRHVAWQARDLATSTFSFMWQAALGDIPAAFAWQPWHLLTSTLLLRGMRGKWHLWHRAGSGGALGRCGATALLHGRCGTVRGCPRVVCCLLTCCLLARSLGSGSA